MYEVTYSNSSANMDQKHTVDATDYQLKDGFFTFTRYDGAAGGHINVFSLPSDHVANINLVQS